jgi:nucleotide-binding universal stress UspA family protein
MVSKRLSREQGHRRKFLAIVDETEECDRAVVYAAARAARTGDSLVLLHVLAPGDFSQWRGVESLMRAEAQEEAEHRLAVMVARAQAFGATDLEPLIREGKTIDVIRHLLEEDRDIAVLVLATGSGKDGPGPLVTAVATQPVAIVPGGLSDDELLAIA